LEPTDFTKGKGIANWVANQTVIIGHSGGGKERSQFIVPLDLRLKLALLLLVVLGSAL